VDPNTQVVPFRRDAYLNDYRATTVCVPYRVKYATKKHGLKVLFYADRTVACRALAALSLTPAMESVMLEVGAYRIIPELVQHH